VRLTVRLKLPNAGKEKALEEYQRAFTRCVTWWLERCREARTSSRKALHRLYYRQAKAASPDLLTLSLTAAQDRAIEAYKAYRRKKGRFPRNGPMASFKAPQYRFTEKAVILHLKGQTLHLPYQVAPRYRPYLALKRGRADLVK
jgi:hypothetical protein